jgi:hypothetical protein
MVEHEIVIATAPLVVFARPGGTLSLGGSRLDTAAARAPHTHREEQQRTLAEVSHLHGLAPGMPPTLATIYGGLS